MKLKSKQYVEIKIKKININRHVNWIHKRT